VTVATNPTPIEFTYQSGGSNTTGSNNLKLRRYNHQLDSWLTGTSKTQTNRQAGAFRIGVVGAVWHGDTGGGASSKKVEHYDPDVWTVKTDSPRSHSDQGASGALGSAGTHGYSFGGLTTTNPGLDTDEYTLTGDTWALKTAIPIQMKDGAADQYGSLVYVVWGSNFTTDVGLFASYEPVASTYTFLANSPSLFLEDFDVCAFDGFVLKVGGRTPTSSQVDLYEISLNTWVRKLVFPLVGSPLEPLGHTMGAAESVPILFGGSRATVNLVLDVWRYNRITDVWTQKANLPNSPGFTCNMGAVATP